MMRDPVCGMVIETKEAVGISEYHGKTFYFCSSTCKEKFDADPRHYMNQPAVPQPVIEI